MEARDFAAWLRWSACALFFMALPLIVFYWMLPFYTDCTLGNDYAVYAFYGQLALQYPLHHGEFPLYIPAGTFGRPAALLTLGQMWHPISLITSHLPGYWGGRALDWNTLYRLLSLGVTHLILYLLLRRVRVGALLAFLISFVTVYNLRMLDMFRYGASLENYTAFLWLCAACAWHFITPTKRAGPLAIVASTYLLICGGHPQMMYYGLIGVAFVILTTPFLIPTVMPELRTTSRSAWRYYAQVGICVLAGVALAAVYILPYVFDFLADGGTHIRQDMKFSADFCDTIYGTFANFFSPLMADVHGAFGGSVLPIMAALIPLTFCIGVRIQRSILLYWFVALAILLWMVGTATPFYALVWQIMPLSNNMRVPGRLGMLLPPIMMWLLVWLATRPPVCIALPGKRRLVVPPMAFVAFVSLVLWVVCNVPAISPETLGRFPASTIRAVQLGTLGMIYCLGILSLIFLACCADSRRRASRVLIALALVCSLVQTIVCISYGTWIDKPCRENLNSMVERRFYKPESGEREGVLNLGPTRELDDYLTKGGLPEFREAWISTSAKVASSREEVYALLKSGVDRESVILEQSPPPVAASKSAPAKTAVYLAHRSANRMVFHTLSKSPGFLVFSYPYRHQWRAGVNGKKATIYRANAIEQAVQIPAGQSTVEFRFWSEATFWGVITSALVACALAIYLIWPLFRWRWRVVAIVAFFLVAYGFVAYWNHLLYSAPSWSLNG